MFVYELSGCGFESSCNHKGLLNEVSSLKESINLLETKSDDSEQYFLRNCLLVHGVEEQEQEDTDNIVLNVIKEHLDIELLVKDLDMSHRIGKINSNIKRRDNCREIFNNKKTIKRHKCFHYRELNC